MKSRSCCMIRFIALNSINLETLSIKLNEIINSHYTNAQISLITNAPYWKYPEENEIIYNISNPEFILVANLIKIFYVSWHYSESDVFDIDIKQVVHLESAIWSKNTHPQEELLMPEINWVHTYTWENIKEPIIN